MVERKSGVGGEKMLRRKNGWEKIEVSEKILSDPKNGRVLKRSKIGNFGEDEKC